MKIQESAENYLETILVLKERKGLIQRRLPVRGVDGEGQSAARVPGVDRHRGPVSSEGFHEVERRVLVESRLEVKGNLPFSCSRHVSPIRCIAWRAPGDASMGARHPAALAVEGPLSK